jgi:hypothetical protein
MRSAVSPPNKRTSPCGAFSRPLVMVQRIQTLPTLTLKGAALNRRVDVKVLANQCQNEGMGFDIRREREPAIKEELPGRLVSRNLERRTAMLFHSRGHSALLAVLFVLATAIAWQGAVAQDLVHDFQGL